MNRLGYRDKRSSFGVAYEGLSLGQDDPGLQAEAAKARRFDPDQMDPFLRGEKGVLHSKPFECRECMVDPLSA